MPADDVPVAVQLVKPLGRVIVGVAGRVKFGLNVTLMVLPAPKAPTEEVVKPSVQVVVAFATSEAPVNVTLVTNEGVIVTGDEGLAAAVSFEVATLNVLAR